MPRVCFAARETASYQLVNLWKSDLRLRPPPFESRRLDARREEICGFARRCLSAVTSSASAATMGTATIQQAGYAALRFHPWGAPAIAFGDRNGRAAYDAVVVGSEHQPWTVLIDARSGEVFASGPSSTMGDCADDAQSTGDRDLDGEAEDN
jgi:hypothetical protein